MLKRPVLDQYKSNQALRRTAQGEERGFTIKKIEYTIECEFQGKTFTGTSLKKKDAKNIAAEAAYAGMVTNPLTVVLGISFTIDHTPGLVSLVKYALMV